MAPAQTAPDREIQFAANRFALKVDALGDIGHYSEAKGLTGTLDVQEYPEGGRNDYTHKLPTRIKWGNITLKRGLTHEQNLLAWFTSAVVDASPNTVSLTAFDTYGNVVRTWSLSNAFPVKWTGPDVSAGGTDMMTESLEIAHHGVEALQ